jgi:hypothetical protein
MAKWHKKEDLTEAGSDLVGAVLARKFQDEATADAAIQVLGSLNDFRQADGPQPFGAEAPVTSEDEAVELARSVDEEGAAFGAEGDGAQISPERLAKLAKIARFILSLWLGV